jgi:TetR/AcrR family transcriptional regulator, ethionamide resistance regulator
MPTSPGSRAPTTPATPTRRRRAPRVSGEERERAILATLRALLATEPFHRISVDHLAAGAGISRPTFYFYFASKEAVLVTLLHQLVVEVQDATDGAPELLADDPAAAWRSAIGATFAMWHDHRDVIRAAADVRSSDHEVRELWSGLLRSFVERTAAAIEIERARGAAPEGIPAAELALCLTRMNERLFEATLTDDDLTLPAEHALDTVVAVWLRLIYATTSPPAR